MASWDAYEEPDWDLEYDALEPHTLVYAEEPASQKAVAPTSWDLRSEKSDTPELDEDLNIDYVAAVESEKLPHARQQRRSRWASTPIVETVNVPHRDKVGFGRLHSASLPSCMGYMPT
jgi:hypothetical protein